MKPRRLMITHEEATPANGQHRKPCSDCPWRRDALAGWLGSMSADEWIAVAHSETVIDCHTLLGAQCAGSAIYRANVCKTPRFAEILILPADRERVFARPAEFLTYHATVVAPPKRRAR